MSVQVALATEFGGNDFRVTRWTERKWSDSDLDGHRAVLAARTPEPLRALRGMGAGRRQIVLTALWPISLGRLLLYFFYRWETCVREATVLGMLGVAVGIPVGWWAAARNVEVVSATLTNVYLLNEIESLQLPWPLLLVAAVIGIGGALLGALWPALDINRRDT